MRGSQRRIFVIVAFLIMSGLSLAPMLLLRPPYGDLLLVLAMFVSPYVVMKVKHRLDARAIRRRLAPVRDVIEQSGPMTSLEASYKRDFFKRVLVSLTGQFKPESPLRSGTRVDAWIRFDGDDWYATAKRGLSNQQRLILQGEIEDILLHAPKSDGDLWIVVVVGLPDLVPAVVVGQINALLDYTFSRVASLSAQMKRRISIEVLPV